jgi:hypothetical protein
VLGVVGVPGLDRRLAAAWSRRLVGDAGLRPVGARACPPTKRCASCSLPKVRLYAAF